MGRLFDQLVHEPEPPSNPSVLKWHQYRVGAAEASLDWILLHTIQVPEPETRIPKPRNPKRMAPVPSSVREDLGTSSLVLEQGLQYK